MISEIGLEEMLRLGAIAGVKVRQPYVEMSPAERALFHRTWRRRAGRRAPGAEAEGQEPGARPFTDETRRRLTEHYKGLQHPSGSLEETALLKHNVLAIWLQDGIPTDFLDGLRSIEDGGAGLGSSS